jgi:hypothetical protein
MQIYLVVKVIVFEFIIFDSTNTTFSYYFAFVI